MICWSWEGVTFRRGGGGGGGGGGTRHRGEDGPSRNQGISMQQIFGQYVCRVYISVATPTTSHGF